MEKIVRSCSEDKTITELKRQIEHFRIAEIKQVLTGHVTFKSDERKDQLKRRLHNLIADKNLAQETKREIFQKISSLYCKMRKIEPKTDYTMPNLFTNVNGFSSLPIHPDVKLKPLPFYDLLGVLLKPSTLIPESSIKVNKLDERQTFSFHLTPAQTNVIQMNRVQKDISNVEYAVQVQLRLCLLEVTSEQADNYPLFFSIKVNSKPCPLPNPLPCRPGQIPRRPPNPLNITPFIKVSPTLTNNIEITWQPESNKNFVISCYLVHKRTSDELLQRIKNKGIKPADFTRSLIKEKLNEEANSEVTTTDLRVSLVCPLGKMRMNTPCRSTSCNHLQCFDALTYLQMNEKKPSWTCPVCYKDILFDNLVIDGYFFEIIKTSAENDIQLHKDGSWSKFIEKSKSKTQINNTATINIISDGESDSDEPPVVAKKPKLENNAMKEKKKAEPSIVDLTLDDDD